MNLRKLFTHMLCALSLLWGGPGLSQVYPELSMRNIDQNRYDPGHWANVSVNLLNGVMGQVNQIYQQQNSSMQAQGLANSMRPKVGPAQFFPQCKMAQAKPNMPHLHSVCNGTSDINTSTTVKNAAIQYRAMYEKLTSMSQNSSVPDGLQCVEDGKKAVLRDIDDRIAKLVQVSDQIKVAKDNFVKNHERAKIQMRQLNSELHGGGDTTQAQKQENLSEFFLPQCRAVYGSQIDSGKSSGLVGISKEMEPHHNEGAILVDAINRGVYRTQLELQKKMMWQEVEKFGVDRWMTLAKEKAVGSTANFTIFSGQMSKAIAKSETLHNAEVDLLSKAVSYPDGEKGFMRDCFVKADSYLGLGFGIMLQEAKAVQSGGAGNAKESFKDKMGSLVRNLQTEAAGGVKNDSETADEFVARILNEVAKVERATGHQITIPTAGGEGGNENSRPSQIFSKMKDECANRFKLGGVGPNGSTPTTGSFALDIEAANKSKEGLGKLKKNQSNKVINDIISQVENCAGSGGATNIDYRECSSDSEPFNDKSDHFCLQKATQCASLSDSCFAHAKGMVEKKNIELGNLATKYNNNFLELHRQSKELVTKMKAQVNNDLKFLRQYFNAGTASKDEDLFAGLLISDPSQGIDSEFGIGLFGEGGVADFDSMEKIVKDKLVGHLKEMKENVTLAIDTYRDSQNAAFQETLGIYNTLIDRCDTHIDAIKEAMAKNQQKAFDDRQTNIAAEAKFCQRFIGALDAGPTPGCGIMEDLMDEVGDVIAINSGHFETQRTVAEFQKVCASAGSESEKGSEEKEHSAIMDACLQGYDTPLDVAKRQVESANPFRSNSEEYNLVKEFLQGNKTIADIEKESDTLAKDGFFNTLKAYAGVKSGIDAMNSGSPGAQVLSELKRLAGAGAACSKELVEMKTIDSLRGAIEAISSANATTTDTATANANATVPTESCKTYITKNENKIYTLNQAILSEGANALIDSSTICKKIVSSQKEQKILQCYQMSSTYEACVKKLEPKDLLPEGLASFDRAFGNIERMQKQKLYSQLGEKSSLGACESFYAQNMRQSDFDLFDMGFDQLLNSGRDPAGKFR